MRRFPLSLFSARLLPRGLGMLAVVLLLSLESGTATAQSIAWRYEYNLARREAQEKVRPIILDFFTDQCYYCNKMDNTTFRDPAVIALMNEQFVPLKVNAESNPRLSSELQIKAYPTYILAAPDGKILETVEGWMESSRFIYYMQRALSSLNNPEWMTRDFDSAFESHAKGDYSAELPLLRRIIDDGKSRPIQVKARQKLQEVEQLASQKLARGKQLVDKRQSSEALTLFTEVLQSFPGTPAASEAAVMIKTSENATVKAQQRILRARELLAQAREDYRTQQYLWCILRCENLAANYIDLTEGAEAIQLANDIKKNSTWMEQAVDDLGERLGLLELALAETYLTKGEPQRAMTILERLIQNFPGTRQADAAQTRLSQIQGQPATRASFRRP